MKSNLPEIRKTLKVWTEKRTKLDKSEDKTTEKDDTIW